MVRPKVKTGFVGKRSTSVYRVSKPRAEVTRKEFSPRK